MIRPWRSAGTDPAKLFRPSTTRQTRMLDVVANSNATFGSPVLPSYSPAKRPHRNGAMLDTGKLQCFTTSRLHPLAGPCSSVFKEDMLIVYLHIGYAPSSTMSRLLVAIKED
jgi:hypothetical protein